MGLRYADLREWNPRIVCCSLSAFGNDGPRAAEGGYDFTIQGVAGWQSLTGEPDHPPMRSGLSLVDLSAGYVAAIAIMAGVSASPPGRNRRRHRPFAVRDRVGATRLLRHMGGEPRLRSRAPAAIRASVAGPVREFPTADGWIVIACPKESLWRAFCEAVGRPEWIDDGRFARFVDRSQNREVLTRLVDECLAEHGTQYWLDQLTGAGVPCGPINDVAAALADPQAAARGAVAERRTRVSDGCAR